MNDALAVPDAAQRELALLRGQAAEPGHQPPLHRVEERLGDGLAALSVKGR